MKGYKYIYEDMYAGRGCIYDDLKELSRRENVPYSTLMRNIKGGTWCAGDGSWRIRVMKYYRTRRVNNLKVPK